MLWISAEITVRDAAIEIIRTFTPSIRSELRIQQRRGIESFNNKEPQVWFEFSPGIWLYTLMTHLHKISIWILLLCSGPYRKRNYINITGLGHDLSIGMTQCGEPRYFHPTFYAHVALRENITSWDSTRNDVAWWDRRTDGALRWRLGDRGGTSVGCRCKLWGFHTASTPWWRSWVSIRIYYMSKWFCL